MKDIVRNALAAFCFGITDTDETVMKNDKSEDYIAVSRKEKVNKVQTAALRTAD